MIGAFHNMERCVCLQRANHWFEKGKIGKIVASPLKKEHGDSDTREVFGALHVRPPGRVQGKSKKEQSSHAIEMLIRGR